jgi:DNA-binding XRE family transcriptional regulator
MIQPLVSSAQCRAARALLGWTQAMLANQAGVARKTVAHFEVGRRDLMARTRRDIMETFERAGVEFIWPGSSGEGVRLLRRPLPPDVPTSRAPPA